MGAVIAIPLLTIALISLAFALWSLYVIAVEALTFARSTRRHGTGETAAHYEPGDHQHVSTRALGSAPAGKN